MSTIRGRHCSPPATATGVRRRCRPTRHALASTLFHRDDLNCTSLHVTDIATSVDVVVAEHCRAATSGLRRGRQTDDCWPTPTRRRVGTRCSSSPPMARCRHGSSPTPAPTSPSCAGRPTAAASSPHGSGMASAISSRSTPRAVPSTCSHPAARGRRRGGSPTGRWWQSTSRTPRRPACAASPTATSWNCSPRPRRRSRRRRTSSPNTSATARSTVSRSTAGSTAPPRRRPSNPVPAIVYPHGGPTSYTGDEWDGVAQYFVDKGYAWFSLNFRGSTTYGRDFERANHGVWGVDDTADCLAAHDHLASLGWVDPERVGIFGASYGSYLALLAVVDDDQHRYACAAAKYGDCDILTSWAQSDLVGRLDLERMMGHPSQARAAYEAGSPIHRVEQLDRADPRRPRRAGRTGRPEAVRRARRGVAATRQDVRVRDVQDRGPRPPARRTDDRLLHHASLASSTGTCVEVSLEKAAPFRASSMRRRAFGPPTKSLWRSTAKPDRSPWWGLRQEALPPHPRHGLPAHFSRLPVALGSGTGEADMRRTLAGGVAALAALTMVAAPTAGAGGSGARPNAQDGDVTLTIGLIQDLSSPNVAVGYRRVGLRAVELAVRHARPTRQPTTSRRSPDSPSRGRARRTG